MGFLPQLVRIIFYLLFSPLSVQAAGYCETLLASSSIERIMSDSRFNQEFMQRLQDQLADRENYLEYKTLALAVVDWSRAKFNIGYDNWLEFVIHVGNDRYQMKVYLEPFMQDRQNTAQSLHADIDQLIVQSALAEIGLARPVLALVPPSLSRHLGYELHRQGLVGTLERDTIYFAAIFSYFDDYNTVVVPGEDRLPHWFDLLGRRYVKAQIIRLERALSRIGIMHGNFGHFIVYPDGEVLLADFDYLPDSGFLPSGAGKPSSIFSEPHEEVQAIFGRNLEH